MIEKSAILTLSCDLDFVHAAEVRRQLENVTAGELIVLDLSGVRFLDSMGLHLLMDFTSRMRPARVILVGARPPIRQVFKTAGIESAFSFEEAR